MFTTFLARQGSQASRSTGTPAISSHLRHGILRDTVILRGSDRDRRRISALKLAKNPRRKRLSAGNALSGAQSCQNNRDIPCRRTFGYNQAPSSDRASRVARPKVRGILYVSNP